MPDTLDEPITTDLFSDEHLVDFPVGFASSSSKNEEPAGPAVADDNNHLPPSVPDLVVSAGDSDEEVHAHLAIDKTEDDLTEQNSEPPRHDFFRHCLVRNE